MAQKYNQNLRSEQALTFMYEPPPGMPKVPLLYLLLFSSPLPLSWLIVMLIAGGGEARRPRTGYSRKQGSKRVPQKCSHQGFMVPSPSLPSLSPPPSLLLFFSPSASPLSLLLLSSFSPPPLLLLLIFFFWM